MALTFDRSQVREWIGRVEDDCAEFVGAEYAAARLIGYISQQRETGALSDAQAEQLLQDANHMMRLVGLGRKYAKLARNPSPEVRIMVLADEERERQRL